MHDGTCCHRDADSPVQHASAPRPRRTLGAAADAARGAAAAVTGPPRLAGRACSRAGGWRTPAAPRPGRRCRRRSRRGPPARARPPRAPTRPRAPPPPAAARAPCAQRARGPPPRSVRAHGGLAWCMKPGATDPGLACDGALIRGFLNRLHRRGRVRKPDTLGPRFRLRVGLGNQSSCATPCSTSSSARSTSTLSRSTRCRPCAAWPAGPRAPRHHVPPAERIKYTANFAMLCEINSFAGAC